MISFSEEALAAANRDAERKIRFALSGSGTRRRSVWRSIIRRAWPIVAGVLAAAAVGVFLAWLWVATS